MKILQGDVLDKLAELPDKSVHCCVTSPPYWGLRDYGVDGQIGLEKTPEEYIAKMVRVFREVKRVLRDDGTCWLNLGDSYAASGGAHKEHHANPGISNSFKRTGVPHFGDLGQPGNYLAPEGLKPKDLCGIPWRVALALQADGWYLRSDIIWCKRNPMPESVTDRPTKSHEYIFLLTKSQRYFYDADAVKEQSICADDDRAGLGNIRYGGKRNGDPGTGQDSFVTINHTRNLRSVWDITTKGYRGAHFATFPPELPERCIKAGTSEKGVCGKCGAGWVRVVEISRTQTDKRMKDWREVGWKKTEDGKATATGNPVQCTNPESPTTKTIGWEPSCKCNAGVIPATVLDCFGGSGTTGEVAERLGRNAILIELNPNYIPLIEKRTHHTNMFTSPTTSKQETICPA
jgi:DNA modification methylase